VRLAIASLNLHASISGGVPKFLSPQERAEAVGLAFALADEVLAQAGL
jgi:hypothetical protein